MKFIIFIFIALLISLVKTSNNGKRLQVRGGSTDDLGIINGKKASIKKFNYLGALLINNYINGAVVIISKQWVLTTGFCVYGATADEIQVRVGSDYYDKGGKLLSAEQVITHENYTGSWDYDIAVIKLTKSIKFSSKVKAIGLGKKDLKAGLKIPIAGWGPTSTTSGDPSPDLHSAKVTTISRKKCTTYYPDDMTPRIMCTFDTKTGPCSVDFGGPLVLKKAVYGIYSGGYNCFDYPSDEPALYTDISSLRTWVLNAIKS